MKRWNRAGRNMHSVDVRTKEGGHVVRRFSSRTAAMRCARSYAMERWVREVAVYRGEPGADLLGLVSPAREHTTAIFTPAAAHMEHRKAAL